MCNRCERNFYAGIQDFGNSAGVMSNDQRAELLERFIEHKKRYPSDNISPPRFIVNALGKNKNLVKSETTMCSAPEQTGNECRRLHNTMLHDI